MQTTDTIVAPATPTGVSALAVVRVSGDDAIAVCNACFSKDILNAEPYTIHYGHIMDGDTIVDEVLLSVFKAPRSYTGEHSIEISGHGSPYITQRIIETLCKNGARMAEAGEFTMRAFLNGKLDLAQAEAVADMIGAESEAGLQMAIAQMKGGFSKEIAALRQELIDFAALIELENDFGEEDVEFANRDKLRDLVEVIIKKIRTLQQSFNLGNVLKKGISTVIAGKPNAGKSTLLNAILNEERAIVTEIEGTTRDTIEEIYNINGVQFRFIDTAGIRASEDQIEQMGVSKALEKMQQAELLIYLFDINTLTPTELNETLSGLPKKEQFILVANKCDKAEYNPQDWPENTIFISAKSMDIDPLMDRLVKLASEYSRSDKTLVNNARHADALSKSSDHLERALNGLNTGLSSDLVALDLRNALHQLGLITGEVSNEEVLGSIFGRFCIGK